MPKNPFRTKSEELLSPKPHGAHSNSPNSPDRAASTPVEKQMRRSSSSRLPKNIRLLDYIDPSHTASGAETAFHYRTVSPSPAERIEEEQTLTTRESQDQISALPAADVGSLRRSDSTKTTLSTLRSSFKDARRPSTGGPGPNKTLASLGHIASSKFNSNKGHTKETKEDPVATTLRKSSVKEAKHQGPKYNFLNPSKLLRDHNETPAKITRPKQPRPSIKDLFAQRINKGNTQDNAAEDIVYESFWSASKRTPRRRAGTYHGEQPSKVQKGSGGSEYPSAGGEVDAGRRPSKAPTLPDILPQPSFESEVRFDIRKFDEKSDRRSAISSGLSEISDQATAPSDSSPEGVVEVAIPLALRLSRARSRQVSNRAAQKYEPETSKKKPSVIVRNLEDPFHVAMPTTAGFSKRSSKEQTVPPTVIAKTVDAPILARRKSPIKAPVKKDATLWESIQSTLRSDNADGKTNRSTTSSQDSLAPRKRWKHADKNYFPPWAVGMPQEDVIWIIQRDQELSRL
ncbi:hypothetical protein MMC10_009360 [Thelotrema lepadinum]|nr:hypothetical protein [Thelotrema lepadinum]